MKKDYNRDICNACNIKKQCEEYRNKNWCIDCQWSLLCLMKDRINSTSPCDIIAWHWLELHSACLLADRLIRLYSCDNKVFITNKYKEKICPRCSRIFSIENEAYNEIQGVCDFCGLATPHAHFFNEEQFPEKQYAKQRL